MFIIESFAQTLLLSSDSLIASLLAGIVVRSWQRRIVIAALFGICDGIGTVCGALVPHALPTLPDLALYAICVIVVALAARRSAWWLWLMPVLLGIDNLSLGASIGMAPASAIASAAIALSGMTASTGVLSVLRAWWNLRIPTTCVGGRRK